MTAFAQPNIGLKAGYIDDEEGWGADMNRNLRIIDTFAQGRVLAVLDAPSGFEVGGESYIVGETPSGAFSGHANKVAIYMAGDDLTSPEWAFITPREGWRFFVENVTKFRQYAGSEWFVDPGRRTRYDQTIGDGSATSIEVYHPLNTRLMHISVFRDSSPYEEIACTIERSSPFYVTISGFSGVPGVDEYRVFMSA